MTNYSKANEAFRQDRELKNACYRELQKEYEAYKRAAEYLNEIYANSSLNPSQVLALLNKAVWQRDFLKKVLANYPKDDTYVGNMAAFMSEDEARRMKEKYPENSID
jgi:hypothetical protein